MQGIEYIPYDGQTHISQGNSYSRMDLRYLTRKNNNHFRLFLFNSLFKRNSQDASHVYDIVSKNAINNSKNSIQTMPHIVSAE